MSLLETLALILLAWAILGWLASLILGKAIHQQDDSPRISP
jgi:hypothetical protein